MISSVSDLRWWMLMVCVSIITGCASTAPSRFYTLSRVSQETEAVSVPRGMDQVVIGVGPITFPEYLDRPQIAVRKNNNEIEIDEFNRWAGSIQEDVMRVVTDNLSFFLHTMKVVMYPWKRSIPVNRQVIIDVSRFDGSLSGILNLTARWTILDEQNRSVVLMNKSSIDIPVSEEHFTGLVAAHSRALEALSKEIAKAVAASVK